MPILYMPVYYMNNTIKHTTGNYTLKKYLSAAKIKRYK